MGTIIHLFKEKEIHFLISSLDKDVLVNATEMASAFEIKPDKFLKLKETENYITILLEHVNLENDFPKYKREDIVFTNDKSIFMHRKLALKFASWLNMEFEIWLFETVDNILFGNYKKHWDAYVVQKSSQAKMIELKKKLLLNPTPTDALAYFKAEQEVVNARMAKLRAIKDQYSMNLFGEE
jgi:hypothetical protein